MDVRAESAGQKVVAKCLITVRGTVERCEVKEGLSAPAAASLVRYLEARQFEPASYWGKPVAVDYTFNILLEAQPPSQAPPSEPGEQGAAR